MTKSQDGIHSHTDGFLPMSRLANRSVPESEGVMSAFGWCLSIESKSVSSFSFKIFCFSSSNVLRESSA